MPQIQVLPAKKQKPGLGSTLSGLGQAMQGIGSVVGAIKQKKMMDLQKEQMSTLMNLLDAEMPQQGLISAEGQEYPMQDKKQVIDQLINEIAESETPLGLTLKKNMIENKLDRYLNPQTPKFEPSYEQKAEEYNLDMQYKKGRLNKTDPGVPLQIGSTEDKAIRSFIAKQFPGIDEFGATSSQIDWSAEDTDALIQNIRRQARYDSMTPTQKEYWDNAILGHIRGNLNVNGYNMEIPEYLNPNVKKEQTQNKGVGTEKKKTEQKFNYFGATDAFKETGEVNARKKYVLDVLSKGNMPNEQASKYRRAIELAGNDKTKLDRIIKLLEKEKLIYE